MTRRLRVVLSPIPMPSGSGRRQLVSGCTVAMSRLGRSGSMVATPDPKPGSLTFTARGLKDAADTEGTSLGEMAVISGQLSLADSGPVFEVTEVPPPQTVTSDPSASVLRFPHVVELQLDAQSFRGSAIPTDRPIRILFADEDVAPFRHVELTAELAVSGAQEAASENDILDVPLASEFLSLLVVDEVAEPLKKTRVSLEFPFDTLEATTDSEGRVRVRNPPGGASALLQFSDPDTVRALLKARWDTVRNKPRLQPSAGVSVLSVSDEFDEIVVPPTVLTVSLQPRVVLGRVVGALFDTNKSFVLPSVKRALSGLAALYAENSPSTLLVVGHADRAGSDRYNDTLSLERADAMAAYLKNDVDVWLSWYRASKPKEKAWGSREDTLMLGALKDGARLFASGDAIAEFRRTRNIAETGPVGSDTRRALIAEYMNVDAAPLPSDIELVSHGCGEHFPEVETPDGAAEERNRRVELFFFDSGFGIQPRPASKNSSASDPQYPEWKRRAQQTHEFDASTGETLILRLTLLDGDHQPLPDLNWSILHEFGQEQGLTDGDGKLSARLPARLESAILVHDFGTVALTLQRVPSVDEVEGLQRRLINLGYDCDDNGTLDDDTVEAVREFQSDQGITVTGNPDTPTKQRLREIYGQ